MADASLKRHPSLQPLSRDHGVGLVFAERLNKAVRASREDRMRIAEQMRAVCQELVFKYLDDEERVLSALIQDEALTREFMGKHTAVRAVAEKLDTTDLSNEPEMGLLSRISDVLDDYVRWEERVLFPIIEQSVGDGELQRLSEETAAIEASRSRPTQQLHHSVALDKQADLADSCGCSITETGAQPGP